MLSLTVLFETVMRLKLPPFMNPPPSCSAPLFDTTLSVIVSLEALREMPPADQSAVFAVTLLSKIVVTVPFSITMPPPRNAVFPLMVVLFLMSSLAAARVLIPPPWTAEFPLEPARVFSKIDF